MEFFGLPNANRSRMIRADGSLHARLSAVQRRRIARDDARDGHLMAVFAHPNTARALGQTRRYELAYTGLHAAEIFE